MIIPATTTITLSITRVLRRNPGMPRNAPRSVVSQVEDQLILPMYYFKVYANCEKIYECVDQDVYDQLTEYCSRYAVIYQVSAPASSSSKLYSDPNIIDVLYRGTFQSKMRHYLGFTTEEQAMVWLMSQ